MRRKTLLMGLIVATMAITPMVQIFNVYAEELTQSARWEGSENIWRVSDSNGGYLSNCWFQDDITKDWYLLGAGDDNTIMFSGLVTDQATGKTYLLNPNHDGTYGKMLTADGTYNINGKEICLTFNQEHNGTFGAITSGLSEVRNTGITEKQLASIPSDSNTADANATLEGNAPQMNTNRTVKFNNTEIYGVDKDVARQLAEAMSRGDYH